MVSILCGLATISLAAVLAMMSMTASAAGEIYVAPGGDDGDPGTKDKPFATLARAQTAARAARAKGAVTVYLRGGTYYLPETLVLTAEDSGTPEAPVVYSALGDEKPVLSGGAKLDLKWRDYKGPVQQADVPKGFATDQLFVNGVAQPLARYPNFDPKVRIFGGYAADAFSPHRAARWADPAGGYIHVMHRHMWGGFHYRITGKKPDGSVACEGGWQNNRQLGMHETYRFVENIFEELDSPGEWFLNSKTGTLYYYPPEGLNLNQAAVEAVRLRRLVEFRGTQARPVRFVTLKGLTFRHAARTFMETREPLLRSDWTIHRGGAVFVTGSEDCTVADCEFDQVGGNAVFASAYNRRLAVRGCHIHDAGASGVCFVGDPKAVRSGLTDGRQSFKDIDKTPGPKTDDYPAECTVEDCLITRCGRVEKQVAGVQISMSQGITVRHCSIYELPRAGINISEGTWGGHLIEFCDVFDTVLETGDHGSFNSWGRDRYWGLRDIDLNAIATGEHKGLPLLDAVRTTIIRNSRWRCDHGWDIDLDDGSSNYHIHNNLCLRGGIKLREGFYRICENNVMAANTFHPHVWYHHSQDIFRRNIVALPYKPIHMPKEWGNECDFNLLHAPGLKTVRPPTELRKLSGADEHSAKADARFVNPAAGDYRVAEGSAALKLKFQNFDMTKFGVQKPQLRAIARTPAMPEVAAPAGPKERSDATDWLGATIKSMQTEGEKSATGMFDVTGVLFVDVPVGCQAAEIGFTNLTVIYALNDTKVRTLKEFLAFLKKVPPGGKITASVWGSQRGKTINWTK